MKSGNLNFLEPSGPLLYLFTLPTDVRDVYVEYFQELGRAQV